MSKPIHVTTATFQAEVLESELPVVVDFWAPWCAPCRQIGPVLDELATTWAGQVKVAKVDVDNEGALAGAFRIQGIPTVVGIRDGAVVSEIVGFRGRASLEELFRTLASQQAVAK